MKRTDEQFDELLRTMARREDTPLPPDLDRRLEAVYARLDDAGRTVKKEEKPVKRKIFTLARVAAIAAVVALCVASMAVGALAFSTERVVERPVEVPVEVPVEPEAIDMDDIGISLILPDEWKDKYTVVRDDERGVYNVFCKSVYDYCVSENLFVEDLFDEISGDFPIMGLLFTVSWADDNDASWTNVPGYELAHTEGGSYVMTLTSDVEYPFGFVDPETLEPTEWEPDDPWLADMMREYPNASLEELVVMNRDYLTLYYSIKDIRLVLNGVMARALGATNG